MELMEAIYNRRSIRRYSSEPVSREMLEQIVAAGTWAATAGNNQPWFFYVVTDPEVIKKIKGFSPGMFGEPKFVIAVCVDQKRARDCMGDSGESLALMDICFATQNILLACHGLGLGACAIRSFHQGAVQMVLGAPQGVVPELLVAGGYPERVPKRGPARRPLEEVAAFIMSPEGEDG